MSFAFQNEFNRTRPRSPGTLSEVRFFLPLLLFSLSLCFPGIGRAKEMCPWLNDATAAGFLNANVTSTVTHSVKIKDDATCEFTHREGSAITELRIEVETMTGPPDSFAAYLARCAQHPEPLKAIGNEALACDFQGNKKQVSQQVVGRVRDRAFIVRITSNVNSSDRGVLRAQARNVAEQVAGFLF